MPVKTPPPTLTIEDARDSLTVAEVAQIMNREPYTVRRWIRQGRLKAIRPGGGSRGELRVTKRDLTEYLNRYVRKSDS